MKWTLFFCALLFSGRSAAQADYSQDFTGRNKLIVLSNGQLIFVSSIDGKFFSQRLYPNGNIDPIYRGDNTSANFFAKNYRLHDCKTNAAVVAYDGNLVIGGSTNPNRQRATLVRLNPMGDIDTSFDGTGIVNVEVGYGNECADMAALPDGKLLVAGSYDDRAGRSIFVSRLTPDGHLDETYADNGVNKSFLLAGNNNAVAMACILGQCVVAGANDSGGVARTILVKYDEYGQRDLSFGRKGIVTVGLGGYNAPRKVVVRQDGKILVAGECEGQNGGTDIFLARFDPDGKPDAGFGKMGIVKTDVTANDRLDDLVLQPDGRILVSGGGTRNDEAKFDRYILLRYDESGLLTESYGYGAPKGSDAYVVRNGYSSFCNNIVLKDNKVLGVSEIVSADSSIITIIFNQFLADRSLGVVDQPEQGFLEPKDSRMRYCVYPNPIRTEATFSFTLVMAQSVTLKLYDINGTEIATVADAQPFSAGQSNVTLRFPPQAAPGHYLLVLTTATGYRLTVSVEKM